MNENNLEARTEVIGTFKDGVLTREEYLIIMEKITSERKYLSDKEHIELIRLYNEEGSMAITKEQYVQHIEKFLFNSIGVTRSS